MMKRTLKFMIVAMLALGMWACGGNGKNAQNEQEKITLEDLKKTEASLWDERGILDVEAAPAAVEQYCKFVEQNPDDKTASDWLFKAFQIALKLEKYAQADELGDKLMKDYPQFEQIPCLMFLMAREVYDKGCHDLDKASSMYQRIISEYPESDWAGNAEEMNEKYLGKTDEEIMSQIMMSQMEEVEGEW